MLIRLAVNVHDEFIESQPEFCDITVTEEEIKRIKELSALARQHDVHKITDFSHVDRFYETDHYSEEEGAHRDTENFRPELIMYEVTKHSVCWVGFYKDVDVRWSTTAIPLEDLVGEVVDMRHKK